MSQASEKYQTYPLILKNGGLTARYALDRLPDVTQYLDATNIESRQENSLSSRLGTQAITHTTSNQPLGGPVSFLGRMKALGTSVYRYGGASDALYRISGNGPGAYTQIHASANPFTASVYRPDLSSYPYIFFAGKPAAGPNGVMVKDNGTLGTAQNWGIALPQIPPKVSLAAPGTTTIDLFEAAAGTYTEVNIGGIASSNRVNTTLGTTIAGGAIFTVTPAAMTNILPGMELAIGGGSPETVLVLSTTPTTFTAFFANAHLAANSVVSKFITGTVASSTVATISKSAAFNLSVIGSASATPTDVINLYLFLSDPSLVQEIKLLFDVGDGSFTQSYYSKSVTPQSYQPSVSGNQTAFGSTPQRVFARASVQVDLRQLGVPSTDLVPADDPTLLSLRPANVLPGLAQWSRIQVREGEFVAVGLAGQIGHDWSNVNAWQIQITTNSNAGTLTVGFDDLFLYGGGGPDSFAGSPYDYRYVYYNASTGAKSNPSVELIASSFVTPRRQGVLITWTASTDPQVTHVMIFRRGGSLNTNWYQVALVPIGTTSYIDTFPDSGIIGNDLLELDNDPPVTSTLPTPITVTLGGSVPAGVSSSPTISPNIGAILPGYILTVDVNELQETVVVQAIAFPTQLTAFFQFAHSMGALVVCSAIPQALPLSAVAFNTVWLAGDPNNPHYLYYSKTQRPESFPPENFIEIGNPGDPIMAIVETRSQLFVFTLTTIYQIFGISAFSNTPFAQKTGVRHGLAASLAWCVTPTSILYRSFDGVYEFTGSIDSYKSERIEWLYTNQTYGPVVPADPSQIANEAMAFYNNEVYHAYTGIDALQHRLIYSLTYQRWRPDSVPATAILYEPDINALIVGEASGMIYQDRVNDYDDGGWTAGVQTKSSINISLQTEAQDLGFPRNEKIFNEFYLDIDTKGQDLTCTLLFDDLQTPVVLADVNVNGRTQLSFNINSGLGYRSLNVAFKLTGGVTKAVTVWQAGIRALVDAENRQSWDTYLIDFGTPSWKFCKQGWFEYEAPDPGGIVVSVYTEAQSTPSFTFTLPQSAVRTSKRVRFPAIKAQLWRIVGTSADDFKMYQDSYIEWKAVGQTGYSKRRLIESV